MANILDVGLSLVKECLRKKLGVQNLEELEDSVVEFFLCHQWGVLERLGLDRRRMMAIIKAPIARAGWQARLVTFPNDLFFMGISLTGYKASFLFLPISWNHFLTTAGFHGVTTRIGAWENTNQVFALPHFKGDFTRWFLSRWYWACTISLVEQANNSLGKTGEEEVVQEANILLDGPLCKKYPDFNTMMRIVRKYKLPQLDDGGKQSHILRKYKMFDYLLPEWKSVGDTSLPVIFVGRHVADDEVLAQMDLWASRQGVGDLSYLYRYLHKYYDDEDAVQEVVIHLWQRWGIPKNQFTFRELCRRLYKQEREKIDSRSGKETSAQTVGIGDVKEIEEDSFEGYSVLSIPNYDHNESRPHKNKSLQVEPIFPCSVSRASAALSVEFHKPVKTIEKWLRRNMKKGVLGGHFHGFSTYADGGVREIEKYVVDKNDFEKARALLRQMVKNQPLKQEKTALIEEVMQARKVGRRAAQRWVKRRLSAGKTTDEIYRELFQKANKGGSAP